MHRFLPLLLLFVAHAFAQERSVKPGINDKFLDPSLKVEEWTEKFETESREIFHRRDQIIASIGLKPGVKIADIGAGTGLFTLPFANAVGAEGKVYAVEIARNFLTSPSSATCITTLNFRRPAWHRCTRR
jgi:tRNA A58 N-methylase Trm61